MRTIFEGIERFQKDVFPKHQERFERLATSQHPEVLFITCSDSRIDPNLVTQANPGDLFHVRNVGNIVPSEGVSGEAAAIEYAVRVLGVRHVAVCGHTDCGGMKALLNPASLSDLPAVREWLRAAEPALRAVQRVGPDAANDVKLRAVIEENVLVQLDHLRQHPAVASALAKGRLNLYGCVYEIKTGLFFIHDARKGAFVPSDQESDSS